MAYFKIVNFSFSLLEECGVCPLTITVKNWGSLTPDSTPWLLATQSQASQASSHQPGQFRLPIWLLPLEVSVCQFLVLTSCSSLSLPVHLSSFGGWLAWRPHFSGELRRDIEVVSFDT